LSQLHPKTILTGGLNIPLLYEETSFKHRFADTQDITVNPTTPLKPSFPWLIIIGALGAGTVVLGIIAAAGGSKEETQKK